MKAQRDLERTVIKAPFADGSGAASGHRPAGQQWHTAGQGFCRELHRIRLPLPEQEDRFLSLPGDSRERSCRTAAGAVEAVVNGKPADWQGQLVRVEGAMDMNTRQVVAVAQVNDPYAKRSDGAPPLKIGQFVQQRSRAKC